MIFSRAPICIQFLLGGCTRGGLHPPLALYVLLETVKAELTLHKIILELSARERKWK